MSRTILRAYAARWTTPARSGSPSSRASSGRRSCSSTRRWSTSRCRRCARTSTRRSPTSSGSSRPTCCCSASLVLVGGSLGDLYGRRRIFAIGVAGFGAGVAGVRDRAVRRGADRRAGAAGGDRRAARPELAGDHHGGLRAGGARAPRSARGPRGPAPRSPSGRRSAALLVDAVVVAGHLRDERPARASSACGSSRAFVPEGSAATARIASTCRAPCSARWAWRARCTR